MAGSETKEPKGCVTFQPKIEFHVASSASLGFLSLGGARSWLDPSQAFEQTPDVLYQAAATHTLADQW